MGCMFYFLINSDMCKYSMLCDCINRIAPESLNKNKRSYKLVVYETFLFSVGTYAGTRCVWEL